MARRSLSVPVPASRIGTDVIPLIQLLGPSSAHSSVSRQLKRGMERYFQRHGFQIMVEEPMSLQLEDRLTRPTPARPQPFAMAGFLRDPALARMAHAAGVALATCSETDLGDLPAARVTLDDHLIGQRAADHGIDSGYHNLACWGTSLSGPSMRRVGGFLARAKERGRQVITIPPQPSDQALVDCLRDLPQDTVLFAHQDLAAHWLAGVCQHWRIAIPQDLGLIGADDDQIVCDSATPPLSSVRIPWDLVGEHLALGLHQRWSNPGTPPTSQPPVKPLDVHVRTSTARKPATKDPVEQAARLLAANDALEIAAIAKRVGVPQSSLLRQFRRRYGMGMALWRQSRRAQYAMELLTRGTESLTLEQVAHMSGLGSRQSLLAACRRHLGMPPSALRQTMGPR